MAWLVFDFYLQAVLLFTVLSVLLEAATIPFSCIRLTFSFDSKAGKFAK
jgi:hypothetical protein